jgi:hypothetical protein
VTLKAEMTESSVVPLAAAGEQRAAGRVKNTVTMSGVQHVVYVVRWDPLQIAFAHRHPARF